VVDITKNPPLWGGLLAERLSVIGSLVSGLISLSYTAGMWR